MDRSTILQAINEAVPSAIDSQNAFVQKIIDSEKDDLTKQAEIIASNRVFTQQLLADTLVKLLP